MLSSCEVIRLPSAYQWDLGSPYYSEVPVGHATVWSFLLKEEPHVLELMLDPVGSLLADQRRAEIMAAVLGYGYHMVPAPPAVRATGIPVVKAFPLTVLRDVFPTNP